MIFIILFTVVIILIVVPRICSTIFGRKKRRSMERHFELEKQYNKNKWERIRVCDSIIATRQEKEERILTELGSLELLCIYGYFPIRDYNERIQSLEVLLEKDSWYFT